MSRELKLLPAKTLDDVVVDHPHGLHEGIANGRYGLLSVRLCGTRCATPQRARVLRSRSGRARYTHSKIIATMMNMRTSASRFPAISMPTMTPARKPVTPKTI